jgi:hypothetical protein
VTAAYAGTADFAASSGTTGVTSGLGGSTVQLQSSENPAARGDAPTFTATVQPVSPASGTPDGTVTFSFAASGTGPAPVCTGAGGDTVTLSAGVATCTLSAGLLPAASPVTVGADYSGSSAFSSSDATPLTETVAKAATTTLTLKASQDPVPPGNAVSFKASVANEASGLGAPQGTITWTITNKNGNPVSCSSVSTNSQPPLLKGTCLVAAGVLKQGKSPYSVTATFVGTGKYAGASATLSEVVGGG